MSRFIQRLKTIILSALLLSALSLSLVHASAPKEQSYGKNIDVFMENRMEHYKIPGAALTVVRNGEVEYMQGYGIANEKGDPVTSDTPFLIASLTKSFTAMGIMQLVEAEKISLEDPIQKYLPWFAVNGIEGNEITVADLVFQTSGFSETDGIQSTLSPDDPEALEFGVRELAKKELIFEPETAWEYSNLNYNILGLLIQEISGQTYESYIKDRILSPLGMDHSFTSLSEARQSNAASGYYPFFGVPLEVDSYLPYSRTTLPAAGLWSSVSDLSTYLITHLNGGQYQGNQLLSEESTMRLHQAGYEFEDGSGYAMGWWYQPSFLDPEFRRTLGTDLNEFTNLTTLVHEGNWLNYKAAALMVPEAELGVVILMNLNDPPVSDALSFIVWDIALIATGAEAQYFSSNNTFMVRNIRWIFGLINMLLIGELYWSLSHYNALRKNRDKNPPSLRQLLFRTGIPLLVDVFLVSYVFLVLYPENSTNLPILLKHAPDIGLMSILVLGLTIGWGAIRSILYASLILNRISMDSHSVLQEPAN